MKLLITGSAGQVGKELVLRAPKDWTVLAVNRQQLDIADNLQVKQIVDHFLPDVIINAAAYTAVDRAESEATQAWSANCEGAKYLAQAAKTCGARLLHISTDYVFSGDKTGCYNENDTTGPTGVYGQSKLAGEMAIAKACPEHIIMRTSWIFGAQGNNFVKTMLHLGRERTELSVVGDQWGSPTYAGDIAGVLLNIAAQTRHAQPVWGIYHYSGMPYVSWAEFAATIFERACETGLLTHKPIIKTITTREYPTAARRPANSRLDCRKIDRMFTIKPSDWQAALSGMAAW